MFAHREGQCYSSELPLFYLKYTNMSSGNMPHSRRSGQTLRKLAELERPVGQFSPHIGEVKAPCFGQSTVSAEQPDVVGHGARKHP